MRCGLARQVGNVDKAAAHTGFVRGQQMHQREERRVADIAASTEGKFGWHAGGLHRDEHRFHRQGAEVGCGCALDHRRIDRLRASIIGDPCVDEIHRDAFETDACATTSLADAEHQFRMLARDRMGQRCQRAIERHRQFGGHHAMPGDALASEFAHDFLRRIDILAAEGFKAKEQDCRHGFSHAPCFLLCIRS